MDMPRLPFLQRFNDILFGWTPWMYRPNLKAVALPVPEIRTYPLPQNWAVPRYAHAAFSQKFLMIFCSDSPCECTSKICKSVALPVPGIIGGTLKRWAVPGYAVQGHPTSLILVPIEIAYATSYYSVIVTLVLSYTVSEILQVFCAPKWPHPYIPP